MIVEHPSGDRLTGFYRGQVLKHLNHGKCKIYIPGVYPEEWISNPDFLPSAEQASPIFGGTNSGNGMFSYPNLNSIVWCFFANGDQNYPVYFASTLGGEDANQQYLEVRNNVSETSLAEGTDAPIHKINCGKTQIKMWESGFVEIQAKDDEQGTVLSKIVLDGQGNINICATQQLTMSASNVKIEAGNSMEIVTPTFINNNSVANHTISPAIELNSQTGMTVIKGKKHSALFN